MGTRRAGRGVQGRGGRSFSSRTCARRCCQPAAVWERGLGRGSRTCSSFMRAAGRAPPAGQQVRHLGESVLESVIVTGARCSQASQPCLAAKSANSERRPRCSETVTGELCLSCAGCQLLLAGDWLVYTACACNHACVRVQLCPARGRAASVARSSVARSRVAAPRGCSLFSLFPIKQIT